MRHLEQPVLLRLVRCLHEDGQFLVQFEARFDCEAAERCDPDLDATPSRRTDFMWNAILPLLRDFEDVLQQYPGRPALSLH